MKEENKEIDPCAVGVFIISIGVIIMIIAIIIHAITGMSEMLYGLPLGLCMMTVGTLYNMLKEHK